MGLPRAATASHSICREGSAVGSPGGEEVGRASVRIVPDVSGFRSELSRDLEAIERSLKVTIPAIVDLDSAGLRAQVEAAEQGLRITIPATIDLDTAGLLARLQAVEIQRIRIPAEIDLDTATLRVGEETHGFFLAETERAKLINGWDDIDLTRAESAQIAEYRESRQKAAPWAWPERPRKGPEF